MQTKPKVRNVFRYAALIFDFEFRDEDEEILLAFSAKKDAPKEFFVRLYEVPSSLDRGSRIQKVREFVEKKSMNHEGFLKSGVYFTAQEPISVNLLAKKFGHRNSSKILSHPENKHFFSIRGQTLKTEDVVYIPQLETEDLIPLGSIMPVEDVDESVENDGHRHQSRMAIPEGSYNPLNPINWFPERIAPAGPTHVHGSNEFDSESHRLWLPIFAVFSLSGQLLGVSPTPPEIVSETNYSNPDDENHGFVFLMGQGSRFLGAGEQQVSFKAIELPVATFPARETQDN